MVILSPLFDFVLLGPIGQFLISWLFRFNCKFSCYRKRFILNIDKKRFYFGWIINIVTGYIANGKSFVIPGGELLAMEMLRYKAALKGILVEEVSECYTSTTCPVCGRRAKSARVERGLFVHCNRAFNADVVGAFNILRRYLQDNGLPLLEVVGALARPVVNLFVWRKATPKGREQGTFKVA